MAKTVLVVHLSIVPDRVEEFLDIARAHARRCVEIEEGCLSFDVLVTQDAADRIILVEVYADNEALDTHWSSQQMAAYREKVKDLVVERQAHICTLE